VERATGTCLIICGALAREVLALKAHHDWAVDVVGVPATFHMIPARIAPAVEQRILALRDRYDRLIVVYGDCGTGGALDQMLDRHGIERIAGPHCYEWYGGSLFQNLMDEEPGTYYLTKGWIEEGKSPLGVLREYTEKYGKETAEWVIREELKNYTRILLIDKGGDVSETHRDHARENARFLNLRYEEIKGSLEYFQKMLEGSWDKDFMILKPGEEVTQDMFF
jgi:hypothetical protein